MMSHHKKTTTTVVVDEGGGGGEEEEGVEVVVAPPTPPPAEAEEVEEGEEGVVVDNNKGPSSSRGPTRISERKAVRCALSIPEEFVPTPHKQFIKNFSPKEEEEEEEGEGGSKKKPKETTPAATLSPQRQKQTPIMPPTSPSNSNGVEGGNEGEGAVGGVGGGGGGNPTKNTLLVRADRERRLRSAFARYKKWDEAERCLVELLDGDKVKVNNETVLNVCHANYVKEADVKLEYDEDWRVCKMPSLPPVPSVLLPLPKKKVESEESLSSAPEDKDNTTATSEGSVEESTTTTTAAATVDGQEEAPLVQEKEEELCGEVQCRMGCVCQSIKNDVVRGHCGKPKCFFECTCLSNIGDDGDIRSRLRPRVSLLNWRFLEGERDKDPPPANYRQLERGVAVYPRMRRVPVAPQRFRNEYIMSSKFKEGFNRERRKSVGHGLKLIRKATAVGVGVKRENSTTLYRRNYLVKGSPTSVSQKESPRPLARKLTRRPPLSTASGGHRSMDMGLRRKGAEKLVKQEPLEIPQVVSVITRDGLCVLSGADSLIFVGYSLEWQHPRVILYDIEEGDIDVPWLYLPFPSAGEGWLLHRIDNLEETTFTYIPEINSLVPSKVLKMHTNMAIAQKKTVQAKILWVGNDSKQRGGSIYVFPQIPDMIVCGPFPKSQMKSKFHPEFDRLTRALNAGLYLDHLSLKGKSGSTDPPYAGWDNFFHSKKVEKSQLVKSNAASSNGVDQDHDDDDLDIKPAVAFAECVLEEMVDTIKEEPTY